MTKVFTFRPNGIKPETLRQSKSRQNVSHETTNVNLMVTVLILAAILDSILY